SEVDGLLTGREIRFFQEWLRHSEPGDPYWELRGNPDVARVPAPVCMVGGWYDIFLPWQLRDYATLRAAGARPRLVIGTWTHADLALLGVSMREGIAWFRAALNGGARGGVRVHIGGRDEWRDLPDWPPHSGSTAWFLGPPGGLAPGGPGGLAPAGAAAGRPTAARRPAPTGWSGCCQGCSRRARTGYARSRSSCGRSGTCSGAGTGSGCSSPGRRIRGTRATPVPASRWVPRPACSRSTTRSSGTPRTRPRCACRSAARDRPRLSEILDAGTPCRGWSRPRSRGRSPSGRPRSPSGR